MVEALAQAKRPDGILCEHGPDVLTDSAKTIEYLERENVTLFQPTLRWGRRLARFDILEKRGSVVRVIEVKAKSIDGEEHRASIESGGHGILRGKKKPHAIMSEWIEKIEDLAFQVIVLSNIFPHLTIEPCLLLVDKTKRSKVDNVPSLFQLARDNEGQGANRHSYTRYIGTQEQLDDLDLLAEISVAEEVAMVRDTVDQASAEYETILDSEWKPSFANHTAECNACEYKLEDGDDSSGFAKCWGSLAFVSPHILDLARVGTCKDLNGAPLIQSLMGKGTATLFDVPEACLCKKDGTVGPQAEQQLRQIRYAKSGDCWTSSNLRMKVEALKFPVHFIDFEASRLALPYHAKMRPYGQVAFQWSCHTLASPGATPVHSEWLNTTDLWPNASFARSLRGVVGDSDTILTWSAFEGSTLREIDRELHYFEESDPELVAWIDQVVNNRIVDLHDWAKNDFYHPGMKGRTSIKVVMDALWRSDSTMRGQFTSWTGNDCSELEDPYSSLPPLAINGVRQDVREGTGAIRAYEAMMYGVEKGDAEAKDQWCELLKQYCNLDTLSMVLIHDHWRRLAFAPIAHF
jgi:hypothetical protein